MSPRPTPAFCPICRKAEPAVGYAPFCSRRCADVDLSRWFSGVYAIAVEEADDGASFAVEDQH